MMENIHDLVRQAQAGDEDARAELLEAFRRPIFSQVRKYLPYRKNEDIEDYVQDIMVKVVAHLDDFDFDRGVKFTTWVFTFVRNHCFDQSKRKRRPTFSMYAPFAGSDDDSTGEWLGEDNPPDQKVLKDEFRVAVRQALAELPDELSKIFALRELQGLEFHMIASRLRLPLGTVKSKHYRALDKLRFALQPFRLATAG